MNLFIMSYHVAKKVSRCFDFTHHAPTISTFILRDFNWLFTLAGK